jgi:hypothetical protein
LGEELNGHLYAQALTELFSLEPDAAAGPDVPASAGRAQSAPAEEANVVPFRTSSQS